MSTHETPLVMIEWRDSVQPNSGWQLIHDAADRDIVHVCSVGWLLSDGEVKVIAPNIAHTADGSNVQACGTMAIPACCVVAITPIKEPRRKGPPA